METTNQIFKEYCSNCGYEITKDIDSKYNYITYWCYNCK